MALDMLRHLQPKAGFVSSPGSTHDPGASRCQPPGRCSGRRTGSPQRVEGLKQSKVGEVVNVTRGEAAYAGGMKSMGKSDINDSSPRKLVLCYVAPNPTHDRTALYHLPERVLAEAKAGIGRLNCAIGVRKHRGVPNQQIQLYQHKLSNHNIISTGGFEHTNERARSCRSLSELRA